MNTTRLPQPVDRDFYAIAPAAQIMDKGRRPRDHYDHDRQVEVLPVDRDFYATMAQVLPVLLLALVWDSGYLQRLRQETRRLRRDDPVSGVRFWTKPRVRIYSIVLFGAITTATGASVLVLAGALPAGRATRGLLIATLLIGLATLLTRILVDVVAATREQPPAGPSSQSNQPS